MQSDADYDCAKPSAQEIVETQNRIDSEQHIDRINADKASLINKYTIDLEPHSYHRTSANTLPQRRRDHLPHTCGFG